MSVFSGIVIAVITCFLLFAFFNSVNSSVSDVTQDNACRALISVQSNQAFKTSKDAAEFADLEDVNDFFSQLKRRCVVDRVKISSSDEKEVFKEVGDEMARCWYRYGEGEYDFLSNFGAEGNWCFVCGELIFDDDLKDGEVYSYSDFVVWAGGEEYTKKDSESINYSDYINMRYYDVENDEIDDIGVEISELLGEGGGDDEGGDQAFKELTNVLIGQYNVLVDLKLKEINPNEETYVVYRFNRVDKSFEEQLQGATTGAAWGVGGAIIGGLLAETVLWGGISLISCGLAVGTSWTVAGAFIFGAACTASGAKTVASIVRAGAKIGGAAVKVAKITKRISGLVKFTKRSKSVKHSDNVVEVTTIGGKFKAFNKVKNFKGTNKDISSVADGLRKAGDSKKAGNLDALVELMDESNVRSLDDIGKSIIKKKKEQEKLGKLLGKRRIFQSDNFFGIVDKWKASGNDIRELEALRDLAKLEVVELTRGTMAVEPIALRQYLKIGVIGAAGGLGAYVGATFNDKSNQYVDIMTKEQYYRLCGTQRFES